LASPPGSFGHGKCAKKRNYKKFFGPPHKSLVHHFVRVVSGRGRSKKNIPKGNTKNVPKITKSFFGPPHKSLVHHFVRVVSGGGRSKEIIPKRSTKKFTKKLHRSFLLTSP
jgi:hypothetical protein